MSRRAALLTCVARIAPLALVALAALVAFSCKPRSSTQGSESAVAAPEALLAEGTLRDPDAFWKRVRTGGGGALMSMPDTAAGVVIARARLDPRLAHLVDGGLPFHVALGEAAGGGLAFAIAMKLRDLAATREALAAWDAGARPGGTAGDDVGGMTRIGSRDGAPSSLPAALSSSGYLVIASSDADITPLGAYAARTVPTKPLPASSLELRAAPGALAQAGVKATNLGAWATSVLLASARRAPAEVFDASAFAACINPALRAQAAMIADLAGARLDIDTGDGELHAVATFSPKPGDNAARARLMAIHPADAAPLLDAPGDATYAWFVSDTSAARADDVSTIAPCLEHALGAALGEDGAKALGDVLSSFARGRGDWDTLAFVSAGPAMGLVLRAPVADGDAASRALGGLTDLVGRPPASDVVQATFGVQPGVVEQMDAPPTGKTTVLSFARPPGPADDGSKGNAAGRDRAAKKSAAPAPAQTMGLAWSASGEIHLAIGLSPKELLASGREPRTLGSDLATAQAVRALGADASFAAVLKPFACCMTGGPAETPLTFGWGRHGDAGWSRLELGYDLLVRLAGH